MVLSAHADTQQKTNRQLADVNTACFVPVFMYSSEPLQCGFTAARQWTDANCSCQQIQLPQNCVQTSKHLLAVTSEERQVLVATLTLMLTLSGGPASSRQAHNTSCYEELQIVSSLAEDVMKTWRHWWIPAWRQLCFTAVFDSDRRAPSRRPTLAQQQLSDRSVTSPTALLWMMSAVLDPGTWISALAGSEREASLFRCQDPLGGRARSVTGAFAVC